MTVETSLDRLIFLNDFGEDINIGARTIKGIFDNPHSDVSAGGEVSFSMQESFIQVRSEDVTSIGQGSIITIRGSSYAVIDIQPDGTGMTMIMLEAQ